MSAEEEQSYSQLPLEERLVHKLWKARLEAYQEVTSQFQKSPNEESEVFKPFITNPEIFKKIVTDSNVVAQESGIAALVALLEYGGTKPAIRLRNSVVPGLVEKGLSSARAGTKQKTTDALLWFIELDTPDPVIELMIPSLSAKLPKLVSGTVKALVDIYANFGAQTISAKLVLPSLPKLFSHADRTVRAETSNLTLELYKWMGSALEQILFSDLKPVQQKDLTKAFEKVQGEKPTQLRFLKSQREALEQAKEQNNATGNNSDDTDVVMGDDENAGQLDPYDLVDPVAILSKLPNDLSTKVSAPKWKDRVETLTEVQKELQPILKLADEDYHDLIRVLAKCVKDVNIQVVSLASNSIESIAKALRKNFHRYYTIVLNPLLERTKEKKQSVLDALNGALDAVFQSTSLSDILDETLNALKHKTPQVRLASSKFLTRCLKETTVAPTRPEIENIITTSIKLVGDTLPDIRTSAFEVVGTLMKITGERELNSYLESIDDIKKNKIKEFFESAEVKSKLSSSKPKAAVTQSGSIARQKSSTKAPAKSPNPAISTSINKRKSLISKTPSSISSTTQLKKKIQPSLSLTSSTIPSKRGPTSPLKNDPSTTSSLSSSRIGTLAGSRGLTGRSLQSTSSSIHTSLLNHSSIGTNNDILNDAEKQELFELRKEKEQWIKEREGLNWQVQQGNTESTKLMGEIQSINNKLDRLNEQHTNDVMTIKSKETQLQRAQSDLEISKLRITQLESEVELIRKQQNINQYGLIGNGNNLGSFESDRFKSFSPLQELNSGSTVKSPTQLDNIDKRVGNLSIDSEMKENKEFSSNNSTHSNILDTNDESWRRAAEVTSQLKARIEKMKAKSRSSTFRGGI